MELKEILAKCDHTLLGQTATWADIKAICDDGMKYKTASVCILFLQSVNLPFKIMVNDNVCRFST